MWSAALYRRFCFVPLEGPVAALASRKNKSGGKAPHSKFHLQFCAYDCSIWTCCKNRSDYRRQADCLLGGTTMSLRLAFALGAWALASTCALAQQKSPAEV